MKTLLKVLAPMFMAIILLAGCTPSDIAVGYFPTSQHSAARCIIRYESGGNPRAVSPGGGNHGLFQINTVHKSSFQRVTGRPFYPYVYEPAYNGKFAHWLWRQQGWGPWSTARRCGV